MPAAALVVLAFLLAPSSGSGQGAKEHDAAAQAPTAAPVEVAPPPSGTTDGRAAAAAPRGASKDEAPPVREGQAELVDPWASVPLQTVVPAPPVAVRRVAPPSTSAPLLDPWAGAARLHVPRQLDPELRDPFHAIRPHHEVPRLAHADLRDPFARRSGASKAAAPVPPAAAAPEPGMPVHPDLRDPFGRRKARPAPPPAGAGATPLPPALPRAPSLPSSEDRASDDRAPTEQPGALVPGALLPSTSPFAHLARARRPA